MWERMKPVVDGAIVVTLEETTDAMRVLAEKARVIAEGAGALSVAAAPAERPAPAQSWRSSPAATSNSRLSASWWAPASR